MGANVTLSTGEVIAVDVSKLTMREWRDFISSTGPAGRDDEIVSKCTGLPVDLLAGDFLRNDYRRLVVAIIKAAREPLADPNSASASTTEL